MSLLTDFYKAIGAACALVAITVLIIAGCETQQKRPELVTGVRTVTVQKLVPVPCVDLQDIPPKFISSMPPPGPPPAGKSKVGVNAEGASADVHVLKAQHEAMRVLLMKCTEPLK